MVDQPQTAKEKLLKDMKRTKGVRFNASRRLERQERLMATNTAYASVAVIIVTLLPIFFSLEGFLTAFIALMTVGLSIFILATTLLHSAQNSTLKADQFHRCALEVNALRRELLATNDEEVDIARYATKYDEILGRYNINHEDVDYDRYRLEHPDEFPDVAAEEVNTARRNVRLRSRANESFSTVVTVITAFVIVGATSFASDLLSVLLAWFELLER